VAQQEELRRLVEAGPDPDRDGVVRWRCVDLMRVLSERFDVDLSQVSLGRTLKRLGFSRISARRRTDRSGSDFNMHDFWRHPEPNRCSAGAQTS
jgi:Winged helix-turn helix